MAKKEKESLMARKEIVNKMYDLQELDNLSPDWQKLYNL